MISSRSNTVTRNATGIEVDYHIEPIQFDANDSGPSGFVSSVIRGGEIIYRK